jgi:hypothetical protein
MSLSSSPVSTASRIPCSTFDPPRPSPAGIPPPAPTSPTASRPSVGPHRARSHSTLGSSLDIYRLRPASNPIDSGGLGFRGRESKVPRGRMQMWRIEDQVSRRRPTGHRAHRWRQHHRRTPSPALPSPSHFLTGLSLRHPRGMSGSGRGSPEGRVGSRREEPHAERGKLPFLALPA